MIVVLSTSFSTTRKSPCPMMHLQWGKALYVFWYLGNSSNAHSLAVNLDIPHPEVKSGRILVLRSAYESVWFRGQGKGSDFSSELLLDFPHQVCVLIKDCGSFSAPVDADQKECTLWFWLCLPNGLRLQTYLFEKSIDKWLGFMFSPCRPAQR